MWLLLYTADVGAALPFSVYNLAPLIFILVGDIDISQDIV